jgi:DNA mismatch repair protein MutS
VERKVVRVVTPGTLTDTELLADKSESILLAVHQGPRNVCGLAWLSVTQGEIHLGECPADEMEAWVVRIAPSELLVSADASAGFAQRIKALRLNTVQGVALSTTMRPGLAVRCGPGPAQAAGPAAGREPGRLAMPRP